jgi:hypothetical protein
MIINLSTVKMQKQVTKIQLTISLIQYLIIVQLKSVNFVVVNILDGLVHLEEINVIK